MALPEAEAERLMRRLKKAADAAQGALPNPKSKAKDTTAKRTARIERLGEFAKPLSRHRKALMNSRCGPRLFGVALALDRWPIKAGKRL